MQTRLPATLLDTPEGTRADAILRACVHCGFCNATCPTYLLTGDERDGPRGRIYLMKALLEGDGDAALTATHLDRCLTCRACETTCPSGVAYGELLDIGRETAERAITRPAPARWQRRMLAALAARPRRFAQLIALAQRFRPLVPARLKAAVPARTVRVARPRRAHARRVILLDGCVQRGATPGVNDRLATLLDDRGIEAVTAPAEGCCGALAHHLTLTDEARSAMRANVHALARCLTDTDAEAIVSSASGCGVMLEDYARVLAHDPLAPQARLVSERVRDAGEYLLEAGVSPRPAVTQRRIALHVPCTLAHGQHAAEPVKRLLEGAGFELVEVRDAHLCCGSAGAWSLFNDDWASRLRTRKLRDLEAQAPELIATANVGCQLHLGAAGAVPVRHWLELLE